MKFVKYLFLAVVMTSISICQSINLSKNEIPTISKNDRIRISEAININKSIGDSLWIGWSEVPFALLFIDDEFEYLIQHPNPPKDFSILNYDEKLRSYIYYRPRIFPTHMAATFPVNGLSTIVIGKAENTKFNKSTTWTLVLLHEHFHQLQNSHPRYTSSVNELDLANGDQTGMWMLNYDFPYDSVLVENSFKKLSKKLAELLRNADQITDNVQVTEYLKERIKFKHLLKEKDYKYFSFQLWAEGISRYVEYETANYIAKYYKVSDEFKYLKDYTDFSLEADSLYQRIVKNLENFNLSEVKRVAFYPFGGAEGILINRINKEWKSKYFNEMFYLENYLIK